MPKVKLNSYDEETKKFDDAIAVAMAVRRKNQNDIATRLKKSQSSISRKLKNIDNMTVGELRDLCSYLGLQIEIRGRE